MNDPNTQAHEQGAFVPCGRATVVFGASPWLQVTVQLENQSSFFLLPDVWRKELFLMEAAAARSWREIKA